MSNTNEQMSNTNQRKVTWKYEYNQWYRYYVPTIEGNSILECDEWDRIFSNCSSEPITWNSIQANPDKPWNWNAISQNPTITWESIKESIFNSVLSSRDSEAKAKKIGADFEEFEEWIMTKTHKKTALIKDELGRVFDNK